MTPDLRRRCATQLHSRCRHRLAGAPAAAGRLERRDRQGGAVRPCRLWSQGKSAEITQLLGETCHGQRGAFRQFCQAVAESLINGNKEMQLLEGLLMGKEGYIRESAEVVPKQKDAGPEQLRMELEG